MTPLTPREVEKKDPSKICDLCGCYPGHEPEGEAWVVWLGKTICQHCYAGIKRHFGEGA